MSNRPNCPASAPARHPSRWSCGGPQKDIEEEVKRKLIGETYRQGIKDQKISVLGHPDIEEIKLGRGQALQFAATVEISPEFELPEYSGLVAKREPASVTEEDIIAAIDALRGQAAKFEKVDRPAQEGDYVVVNYTGTCEGNPISDLAPAARRACRSRKTLD